MRELMVFQKINFFKIGKINSYYAIHFATSHNGRSFLVEIKDFIPRVQNFYVQNTEIYAAVIARATKLNKVMMFAILWFFLATQHMQTNVNYSQLYSHRKFILLR